MKVKELKEKLNEFDDDMEIVSYNENYMGYYITKLVHCIVPVELVESVYSGYVSKEFSEQYPEVKVKGEIKKYLKLR